MQILLILCTEFKQTLVMSKELIVVLNFFEKVYYVKPNLNCKNSEKQEVDPQFILGDSIFLSLKEPTISTFH
jgi:hypothetical protein